MDAVVIGAGIVGASCAYHLAARGARVTVLEREPVPAAGSTGRSAAGIRAQFSHPVNVEMSLASMRAFDAFERTHGVDPGYRRVGYLFLLREEHLAAWQADLVMQRERGARIERLSTHALAARFPYLHLDGVAEGRLGLDDGTLDPHAVTAGYLRSARMLGASVRFGARATGARRSNGRWTVDTTSGPVSGDVVVNAAGPQAAAVSALAGVTLPVAPVRRIVYVTSPIEQLPKPTPLIVDAGTGVYLRSEGERVMFGRSNPREPEGENLAVDWTWLEPTLEVALPRFPFLEEAELDRRACWAGLYEMTPDGLPVIGPVDGAPGWLHACGFSGHGVQHAPATGMAVAEVAVEGTCRTFDLGAFALARFGSGGPGDAAGADRIASERNVV